MSVAARLNCQSRYGLSEIVGSLMEQAHDRMYGNIGLDNGVDGLWLSHALKASDQHNSNPTGFDPLRGTVPAVKTAGADITNFGINNDLYNQSAVLAAPRRPL